MVNKIVGAPPFETPKPFDVNKLRAGRLLLRAVLLHVFSHRGNGSGAALLRPLLKPFRGFLQISKHIWIFERLTKLRYYCLQLLPHAKELPTSLKEEIFVEESVVE